MEERFGASGACDEGVLFVLGYGLVLLGDVHGEAEVGLVSGRDGGGDGMRKSPA